MSTPLGHSSGDIPISGYSALTDLTHVRYEGPMIPATSAWIYSQIGTPYSTTKPPPDGEKGGPKQITVPLPDNVDPDCQIELKNKNGSIGLQIAKCGGRAPASRIKVITQEIEKADELLFPPLQYVDRALFPGETAHERPTSPIPNRYDRVTLAVLLSAIVLKQRDWMKQLKETLLYLWENEHPVWVEWSKRPTLDRVWIVALRRTLPDEKGRVYWIPEIELRSQ